MPTKYSSLPERRLQQSVVRELEEMISPRGEHSYRPDGADYGKIKRRLKTERARLEAISPPQIETDGQRDAVIERLKLLETAMREGSMKLGIPPMPTQQQMWEGTDVNVDTHSAWESKWKNINLDKNGRAFRVDKSKGEQGALMEWKDLRRLLFQDEEEDRPSIASIDYMRPQKTSLRDSQRKTFSTPNLTWEEYDHLQAGTSPLSDVQFKVRCAEDPEFGKEFENYEEYRTENAGPGTICGAMTASGAMCQAKPMKNSPRCHHHQKQE